MNGIWNFDFLNHGHLDLLVHGKLFGVVMMNRVNFVRHFDLDYFARSGKSFCDVKVLVFLMDSKETH